MPYQSIKELSKSLGKSERTIRRAIARIDRKKQKSIVRMSIKNGKGKYMLDVSYFEALYNTKTQAGKETMTMANDYDYQYLKEELEKRDKTIDKLSSKIDKLTDDIVNLAQENNKNMQIMLQAQGIKEIKTLQGVGTMETKKGKRPSRKGLFSKLWHGLSRK